MGFALGDILDIPLNTYYRDSPWERLKVPCKEERTYQSKYAYVLTSRNGSNDRSTIPRSNIWKSWDRLSLILENIPSEWCKVENKRLFCIWKLLHKYGNITYMKLQVPDKNAKHTTAIVEFSPPPDTAFWEPGDKIVEGNISLTVRLNLKANRLFNHKPAFSEKGYRYGSMVHFPLSSLDLGQRYDQEMVSLFGTNSSNDLKNVQLSVNFSKKRLSFTFNYLKDKDDEIFRLDFDFQMIVGNIGTRYYDDHMLFDFEFRCAPSIFRKAKVPRDASTKFEWTQADSWRRQCDLISQEAPSIPNGPLTLLNDSNVPIGRCNHLLFTSYYGQDNTMNSLAFLLRDLEKLSVRSTLSEIILVPSPDYREICSWLQKTKLSNQTLYWLEACVSQFLISEFDLPTLIPILESVTEEQARSFLESTFARKVFVSKPSLELVQNQSSASGKKFTSGLNSVKKVCITPTTVKVMDNSLEAGNRVIRHFSQYNDRFLRIQITEENTKRKIRSNPDALKQESVYARVYQLMSHGIIIGKTHFEFLAFGNSQLREHGAYFFASGEDESADSIRNWMGDFSNNESVAKYAARMGQCFSTTKDLKRFQVKVEKRNDIIRNDSCFTDGVGMASLSVMKRTASEMDNEEMFPSAVQFRMGGYKGVLSLAPPTLLEYHKGNLVFTRDSQEKFKSNFTVLEVIKVSRFSHAHLNMQLITLLEGLGVPTSLFVDLAKNELKELTISLKDPRRAVTLLRNHVDEYRSTLILADLIACGFMQRNDSFTKNLINLYFEWVVRTIKEKQRLRVKEGAFLMGVADETGTLKGHYNDSVLPIPEVFIQITDPSKNADATVTGKIKTTIIMGLCVVVRNPALHPGDVRVCRAVRCNELLHLKNVIVFPTTGDLSVTEMCAGGDLDGDEYTVIWDPNFLPKIVNYPPYIDNAAKRILTFKEGVPPIESIKAFFVRYIKYESLGLISNSWKAWAHDRVNNPDGIFGSICLKLSALHSTAVDYPKSGVAAIMPQEYRPKAYPDFMEKEFRSFPAMTAVGEIYRYASAFQSQYFKKAYSSKLNNDYDETMKLPPYKQQYIEIAKKSKEQYDNDLRSVMTHFDIKTEYEIFTSFLLLNKDKETIINEYALREEIAFQFSALKKHHTENYFALCGLAPSSVKDMSKQEYEQRIDSAVAAAYDVMHEEKIAAIAEGTDDLVLTSFPYIFHKVLCRIARRHTLESLSS
ncbi:RNA-directed RNA polymerase Rdp1 [Schizosaccharomyces japonicus yFS275]|uniref:RNA-dependent RNA polymerase n=1 Tax=Schizosaccharomyces japonicus (strain yFS275 / FY16936) TaxID=402676 RepID=B6K409_SCHJY|nr:RNA-directed RNA polymerase Rdp1 [Schizosaccharomyces japonicus yFS275]EEB08216.1 RNA-directed RNA polymerase Rdp1 [Schizosaccharomyces japonicus yFS275]